MPANCSSGASFLIQATNRSLRLSQSHAKALYPHWGLFLADSPYLRSRRNLLTLVESDPAVAVRIRACHVLVALLDGSMAYLAIAEDRSVVLLDLVSSRLSPHLQPDQSVLHLPLEQDRRSRQRAAPQNRQPRLLPVISQSTRPARCRSGTCQYPRRERTLRSTPTAPRPASRSRDSPAHSERRSANLLLDRSIEC